MRVPDFIIGGAPRSGTTWLVEVLKRHPQIALAQPVRPEPKFFLVDELYAQGLEHYSRTWFAEIPDSLVAGEKSTNYLESPTAAQRIAADLPEVRVVFLLRDPITRAYSNWRWSRANGMEAEDFLSAIEREPQRDKAVPSHLRYARPHAYFSRGLYADLLRPWVELLGLDRMLVLTQEEALAQPAAVGRLHRFLGVTERPGDASDVGVVNAAPDGSGAADVPPDARAVLADRYAGPEADLIALLGGDFPGWRQTA